MGSGKSTELNHLVKSCGDEYFVVKFSVENEMSLIHLRAEDLLFTGLRRSSGPVRFGVLCV
jgi:hypothetical protein